MRTILIFFYWIAVFVLLTGCGKNTSTPPNNNHAPGEWRWPENAGSDGVQYGAQTLVTGGSFLMGWNSANDPAPECGSLATPVSSVTISSFYLDKYEVTNGAFQYYADAANPPDSLSAPSVTDPLGGMLYLGQQVQIRWYGATGDTENFAVMGVSWWGAVYYANWRSQLEGLQPAYNIFDSAGAKQIRWDRTKNGYRLPTEAEWEYAARSSSNSRFAWGNSPFLDTTSLNCRCAFKSIGTFTPQIPGTIANAIFYGKIGRFNANPNTPRFQSGEGPFHNFDLNGSAAEWVYDYLGDYTSIPKTDPCNETGTMRVSRGGSQLTGSNPQVAASIYYSYNREYGYPNVRYGREGPYPPFGSGFRLARNL